MVPKRNDLVWAPCRAPGAECHDVSSCGRVRNGATLKERPLRLAQNGYQLIQIKKKTFLVHRLVALTFLRNPGNLSDVDHIDNVKTNNHVSNLQWLSRKQNMQKAWFADGAFGVGEDHSSATLTNRQAEEVKASLANGERTSAVAKRFGVNFGVVNAIKQGKVWRHIPGDEEAIRSKIAKHKAPRVQMTRGDFFDGKWMSIAEISRLSGIAYATVLWRWNKKLPLNTAADGWTMRRLQKGWV